MEQFHSYVLDVAVSKNKLYAHFYYFYVEFRFQDCQVSYESSFLLSLKVMVEDEDTELFVISFNL